MKVKSILVFLSLFAFSILSSQVRMDTVIAINGDGIFSLLRKSGINPVKYYEGFYKLNEKDIRNGSELIVGKKYLLPEAPDSFKNMGVRIAVDENKEKAIFDKELPKFALKDSTLKNTVYYLMYSNNLKGKDISESSNNFIIRLAKELLIRSAKVYILEDDSEENGLKIDGEYKNFQKSELGKYTGIINKKYLMNSGNYQRLIVLQEFNKSNKNYALTVQHHSPSKEGQMLAGSLQDIFRKNAVRRTTTKKGISSFEDETSIYLAKNVLPTVTTISLDSGKKALENGIEVKPGRTYLAKMITNGILNDYSNNNFSD